MHLATGRDAVCVHYYIVMKKFIHEIHKHEVEVFTMCCMYIFV